MFLGIGKPHIKIPRGVIEFSRILKENGYECYVVGGAVRNALMGKKVEDYDIATNATPKEVKTLFKRVIETGIKHGTVTVLFKGLKLEVTTFRTESDYSDGRHPDRVQFVPSIYEDLKRRDFTVNAIAYDPISKKIIDPHSGIEDIRRKTIRAIGRPEERFHEDGLRVLRACRFAAQLGFKIEKATLSGIAKSVNTIDKVSRERIRDELIKILDSSKPSIAFIYMKETGLLKKIIPELYRGVGIEQRGLHCFDVFYHSVYTCDAAPRENYRLRLAALFHDIGKPEAAFINEEGEIRFHNHEILGARIAERVLKELRFSNEEIEYVTHLVRHHMFNYTDEWSDSAVRRFIYKVGKDYIQDLLALRRADQIGTCNRYFISENLIKFEDRINRVIAEASITSYKDLKINGDDIMKHLKIGPGKTIGIILKFLLDSVLEDPSLNKREILLTIAKNFYEERLKYK